MTDIIRIEDAPPVGHLTGMGLLRAEDARDRRFALRQIETGRTFRNWLMPGPVLDQGATSQCVIYAGDLFLTAHRTVNMGFGDAAARTAVYRAVQAVDEWPGDDYDGTSVRALYRHLRARGLIGAYRWAFDLRTVTTHVLELGPVVMGTEWSWDMFQPDEHGYVYYNTPSVGGHAWVIGGVNMRRKNPDGTTGAARCQNSWGEGWGQKGRFWLPLHALERLIKDWGEAGVATEIRVR